MYGQAHEPVPNADHDSQAIPHTRGRSRVQQEAVLITKRQEEDLREAGASFQSLLLDFDAAQTWHDWNRVWEALNRVLDQVGSRQGCLRAGLDTVVQGPLHALQHAWHDVSSWPTALTAAQDSLRNQLSPPVASCFPILSLKFTQAEASDTFRHGVHRGKSVVWLADKLVSGAIATTDANMTLDAVKWDGEVWSLNNRHLKALHLYIREVHPE